MGAAIESEHTMNRIEAKETPRRIMSADDIFGSDNVILDLDEGPTLRALGFKGGRLAYFDGEQVKPVTLRESLQIWLVIETLYSAPDGDDRSLGSHSPAKLKWLRMITPLIGKHATWGKAL
jgi:hypothetical protein